MTEPRETAMHPQTPDGRYFVVNGVLWRCSNPALTDADRQHWVNSLMAARRRVKAAKSANDPDELAAARVCVQEAKVALGERGPVWWTDGAPDFNRRRVDCTPYAQWFNTLTKLSVAAR